MAVARGQKTKRGSSLPAVRHKGPSPLPSKAEQRRSCSELCPVVAKRTPQLSRSVPLPQVLHEKKVNGPNPWQPSTAPVRTGAIRVAVYSDRGTWGSPTRLTIRGVLEDALKLRPEVPWEVDAIGIEGVQNELDLKRYDVLIFPGGNGNHICNAIGETGLEAVQSFVAAGGAFIGTCAGAVLAIKHLKLFGELPTEQPWDRGRGEVQVEFADAGLTDLHLDAKKSLRAISYGQGPIVPLVAVPDGVSVLAHFRTEIHSRHPEETAGKMINAPAILACSYGLGRVIANSTHPESMKPPMMDVYYGFMVSVIPSAFAE